MPEGETTQEEGGGLEFTMGANPFTDQGADVSEEASSEGTATVDAAKAEEAQTIEIDGKPVDLDELKKGYLRQSDYTKKTQELSETKATLDRFNEQLGTPEGVREFVANLQRYAVQRFGEPASTTQDDFEYAEGETRLKSRIEAQDKALATLRAEIASLKEGFVPELESIKAERRMGAAIGELKDALGVDVAQADLRRYMAETGIDDPVKAYKVATYEPALKSSYVQGHQKASQKPAIPKGSARGVNEGDENMDADDWFAKALQDADAMKNL